MTIITELNLEVEVDGLVSSDGLIQGFQVTVCLGDDVVDITKVLSSKQVDRLAGELIEEFRSEYSA